MTERGVPLLTDELPDGEAPSEAVLPAHDVEDLFRHDGGDFVTCCYWTFLGRLPEQDGFQLHLDRLRDGMSKAEIAFAIANSREGRSQRRWLPGYADMLSNSVSGLLGTESLHSHRDLVGGVLTYLGQFPISRLPSGIRQSVADRLVARDGVLRVWGGATRADAPGTEGVPALWMDLTTVLTWRGGITGRIRTELELARHLKRSRPTLRFSVQTGDGFAEADPSQLGWLLSAENVVDEALAALQRAAVAGTHLLDVSLRAGSPLSHPFRPGDVVFSLATVGTRREELFTRLRRASPDIRLCSLVYDADRLAAGPGDAAGRERLESYVRWLSDHADLLLTPSEIDRRRLSDRQSEEGWGSPPSRAVPLGAELPSSLPDEAAAAFLARYGIDDRFVLAVGTIGPRMDLDTVYRAWLLARELSGDVPQLVFCGITGERTADALDLIDHDPRLVGKVVRLQATDAELATLYERSLLTIVPALGAGSAMTLSEGLAAGKLCIASDTPELREVGGDAAIYTAPHDVRSWAELIARFSADAEAVRRHETAVRARPARTWADTALAVLSAVDENLVGRPVAHRRTPEPAAAEHSKPTIWMDLTLTFLDWGGHVTGIIRAELTFAYYLHKLAPDTRYFAHVRGPAPYFFEIKPEYLAWLFDATDLAHAYESFHGFWRPAEAAGTAYKNPFATTGGPVPSHPAYLPVFPANSVVFFAAIDQDGTGKLHRITDVLNLVRQDQAVMTSQLIYDLTPILIPQVHAEWTVRGYAPFVQHVSDHFDHLLYGGRTARRDAIKIQKENGWRTPPSDFVEFGSDLALAGKNAVPPLQRVRSNAAERRSLKKLGVTGDFVMTVGSLEPRKNHEMLYKAYLRLLDEGTLKRPLQMIFVGRRGWKVDDLLATLASDERIKGRLLIVSPSDEELEALYFNCLFTLLPSFYEGWSLTLPESLSYGKFCLVSDVDPLRETGADLVEYVHPLDTYAWADRIAFYANNPDEIARRERTIREGWNPRTWKESTEMLIDRLHQAHAERFVY